jgi:N-acetyl-ornithine/N-acetyl-lysine deacetylase
MSPDITTLPPWTARDEEDLLAGMLDIFTPSGMERPLSEWLSAHLFSLGLETEVDAVGNLIATLPATQENADPPIVLLGHIDTVPGKIPVRRMGDCLFGRGAVDAKGPFAAFLSAAMRVSRRNEPRNRPIIVVGAVEEETATSRGARAVIDRWRPAYAIIGEPSGAGAITLGYKGRLLVTYRVMQSVAHTARPEESVCARAVAFWLAAQRLAQEWNAGHNAANDPAPHFAAVTPTLRSMRSGSDGFAEWCEIEIGYRLPPNCDVAELQEALEQVAQIAGAQAQVSFRGAEVAYRAPRSGPLVGTFLRAIRADGGEPAFKLKTGTSDMNVVGPVWNCPILAYGPGDATLDHTPNEHISLEEYHRGIAVLERVLVDLVTERSVPQ